jgi:hypothetical protein
MTIRYNQVEIPPGADLPLKKSLENFRRALEQRENWIPLWEEAYDYSFPNRQNFHSYVAGQKRTDLIFDDTAPQSVPKFASRILSGLFPENARAFHLKLGPDIAVQNRTADAQVMLDELTQYIHESIWNSNFHEECHEAMQDLAVGTMLLYMQPGEYLGQFKFKSIPLTNYALLQGPHGFPKGWYFWNEKVTLVNLAEEYKSKIKYSEELKKKMEKNRDMTDTVITELVRDFSKPYECYDFRVFLLKCGEMVVEDKIEGYGSLPMITARWSKSSSELYGRGPLIQVMPSVKVVNHVTEMILQNAEMALAGTYVYDDDGVFNPHNVFIEPGAFIPRAPGSSIDVLPTASKFDIGQMTLEERQRNIRKGLFVDDFEKEGKTPLSATEVMERRFLSATDMGTVQGRLKTELLNPLIRRAVYLLNQQGIVEIPNVDGNQVVIYPESPLLRAQKQQDIQELLAYNQQLVGMFGQMGASAMKYGETAAYLAELHGIPQRLILSKEQMTEMTSQVGQAVGEGQIDPDMLQNLIGMGPKPQ